MKTCAAVEVYLLSLGSVLDGGEWSASCPWRFIPGERAPGTHWIGGYVSLSGCCGEEKILLPLPGFEPWSSSP
jgi:hypothetical protein